MPESYCADYREVTATRAREPEAVERAWFARPTRPLVRGDGRLLLLAADHPARGVLAAGGRADAMHDRTDLLDRLRVALADPRVDGLLATADILDDLVLLGALADKVVIASMNRGGIAGAVFELDDRMTGATAGSVERLRMNGGKMLCRVDLSDPASVATLAACAAAVDELAARRLVALVEPFLTSRHAEQLRNDLTTDAVIRSVHIAQGLGSTSAYTWLKLPVVAEMERVMAATTLPALLLGGDPQTAPEQTFESWRRALRLPAVRGLVAGRALLYPPDDDVAGAVATAAGLVR